MLARTYTGGQKTGSAGAGHAGRWQHDGDSGHDAGAVATFACMLVVHPSHNYSHTAN